MFVIELNGVLIGLAITAVACLYFFVQGVMHRRKWGQVIGRILLAMLAFPVVAVLAMFAIEPWYVYRGSASDVQHWTEHWITPPDNTVNIRFQKTRPGGAFYGTTDFASWEAWRIKNEMVNGDTWKSPAHLVVADLFPELDVGSGKWNAYRSNISPRGGARQTWFRESDGTVVYLVNGW